MTRRSGGNDGTFYFQAWHVDRVVSGESWVQNKGIADFVEQNLSPDAKKWLFVKACVPTKEKPGLLVPVSICVKLRAAKIGQNPMDAKRALLQFRNKEYPSIARSYFLTRLRKSLDFFNAFSEGAESDSFLADFNIVKSSKQLKERVQAAMKHLKKESLGDIVHGLAGGASQGSEFKAARFIARRGQGMYKDIESIDIINICLDFSDPASNPHILPATPLRNPLPLPDTARHTSSAAVREPEPTLRPRKASDASDITVGSTDGSGSDASSTCSVETTQSSVVEESSSPELHDGDAKESSSESSTVLAEDEQVPTTTPAAEETPSLSATADTSAAAAAVETPVDETPDIAIPADSSEASYQETPAEATGTTTSTTSSSGIIATRRKMNCVVSQDTQTAYFVVQNGGNWLQYLMAGSAKNAQQLTSTFFDSPVILAASVSPLEALTPDGMMRVYFMSQAKKQQHDVVRDDKGRVVRTGKGRKPVREWVVGSAKISTRALTMHLGKQLEKRKARLLPAASPAVRKVDSVVGPNNRLIEMTAAPGIPQAVLISTPHPVEEVREGDIVEEERDDGFVHIETKIVSRPVEEEAAPVADKNENIEKKDRGEKRAKRAEKKPRSKGKAPYVKNKSKTNTKTNVKTNTKKTTEMDQKTDTNSGARADVKTDVKVDANNVPPRKPSKVYTPPFSRKSWRDVEPQEPQVIYDVMSGYDFLQVEDVQVFSFSTSSHDMMLRTTPAAAAAVEEGDGIGVWSPPVVGIISWMWDYLSPGGWSSKATATAN
ncbi:hypothetical protein ACHAQJ_000268 [Trichoderma viride]